MNDTCKRWENRLNKKYEALFEGEPQSVSVSVAPDDSERGFTKIYFLDGKPVPFAEINKLIKEQSLKVKYRERAKREAERLANNGKHPDDDYYPEHTFKADTFQELFLIVAGVGGVATIGTALVLGGISLHSLIMDAHNSGALSWLPF